jgi:Zn-dependent protease
VLAVALSLLLPIPLDGGSVVVPIAPVIIGTALALTALLAPNALMGTELGWLKGLLAITAAAGRQTGSSWVFRDNPLRKSETAVVWDLAITVEYLPRPRR